jgi:hypothetical protein
MPTSHGFVEGVADRTVYVMSRSRGQPSILHPGVQALEVLRLESLQPMSPDAGDQVPLNIDPVTIVRVVRHSRRHRDAVDPVREPVTDSPTLPGAADPSPVASLFQLADLLRDLGPGPAHDVPAIRLTVVPHTHGHAAVPVAVATLVDA